jgi:hypothetical protein
VSRHGPRPSSPLLTCRAMPARARSCCAMPLDGTQMLACHGVRSMTVTAASTMLHSGGSGTTLSSRGSHGAQTSPPVPAALLRLLCVHARSNATTAMCSVVMADAPTRYSSNPSTLHSRRASSCMSSGGGRKGMMEMTAWRKQKNRKETI